MRPRYRNGFRYHFQSCNTSSWDDRRNASLRVFSLQSEAYRYEKPPSVWGSPAQRLTAGSSQLGLELSETAHRV